MLLDIMSKSYKKGMNEMDSVGVGIVEMLYNWLRSWNCGKPCLQVVEKCITAYFMELWVTMFAGRGKAALCFSMCCEYSYP